MGAKPRGYRPPATRACAIAAVLATCTAEARYEHRGTVPKTKTGHVPVREIPIDEIYPSPENDQVYRPIDPQSPEIIALAENIREHGIKEPIVITRDRFILSGHRRYAAAKVADLSTVPCRFEPISREDDRDEFLRPLCVYNLHAQKSLDERLREEVISADPEEAYLSLLDHRRYKARICEEERLSIVGEKRRCEIRAAKEPFLDAILGVLEDRRTSGRSRSVRSTTLC